MAYQFDDKGEVSQEYFMVLDDYFDYSSSRFPLLETVLVCATCSALVSDMKKHNEATHEGEF